MEGLEIVLGAFKEETTLGQTQEQMQEGEDEFLKIQSMVNHMDNGVIYGKEQ